ncbi:MAG: hypothetical protein P8Y01_05265 [Woeseiaceae bacterium]|jgi:hypothetical protein
MIEITDNAMALCRETVHQLAGAQTNSKCLRLLKRNGRVSISFEMPRNDDTIVHHDGQSVLAVPEELAGDLEGRTLDLADDGSFVIA